MENTRLNQSETYASEASDSIPTLCVRVGKVVEVGMLIDGSVWYMSPASALELARELVGKAMMCLGEEVPAES